MNPNFIEREAVLKTCPDRNCRRSRQCRATVSDMPCAKTHESLDAARHKLASMLERMAREAGPGPDSLDKNDPDFEHQLELRLAEFKAALERREAELAD